MITYLTNSWMLWYQREITPQVINYIDNCVTSLYSLTNYSNVAKKYVSLWYPAFSPELYKMYRFYNNLQTYKYYYFYTAAKFDTQCKGRILCKEATYQVSLWSVNFRPKLMTRNLFYFYQQWLWPDLS